MTIVLKMRLPALGDASSPLCDTAPLHMPRELLLLRHAKSDWNSGAGSDFERPLAKRGKRDVPRIGAWLYREGLIPDLVISSPAERARQTATKVCKSLDLKKKLIHWDSQLYEADASDLLSVLARCPKAVSTVLLIGHNPGLEELLRHLAGEDLEAPDDGKLLPTATVARLEMPQDWQSLTPGSAHLIAITRPRQLD